MNKKGLLGPILIFIIILIIILGIIQYLTLQKYECKEYKTVYYRGEAAFLGPQHIETTKEKADYSREECVKWVKNE